MRKQMSLDAHSYATTQSWDEISSDLLMHYDDVIQSRSGAKSTSLMYHQLEHKKEMTLQSVISFILRFYLAVQLVGI